MYQTISRLFTIFLFCVAGWVNAQTLAITAQTIHTAGPLGTIKGGMIMINDGVITSVGTALPIPRDAKIINAKTVTPGLFDSSNSLGLTEISLAQPTVDFYLNEYDLNAGFDVSLGLNMSSSLVAINRLGGITGSMVTPFSQTDVFQGQGVAIQLTEENYILNAPKPMFAVFGERASNLAGGSRAAALTRILQGLDEAFDFANEQSLYQNGHWPYRYARKDLNELVNVINGARPLVVSVDRAEDIKTVLKHIKRYPGVRLILLGATEAYKVAKELASAKVGVVFNPLNNLPISFDALGARLDAANRLHQAGVLFAFATFDTHNARLLRQLAGNAVAHGLPYEAAIKAMTSQAASIWQLPKQGQISPLYKADLVLWSGDPLEVTEHAEQVIINGEVQSMRSRQLQLKERYQDLQQQKWPFAYQ